MSGAMGGFRTGSNRVLRGGDWNNNANNARSANHNNNSPGNSNNNNGFRLLNSFPDFRSVARHPRIPFQNRRNDQKSVRSRIGRAIDSGQRGEAAVRRVGLTRFENCAAAGYYASDFICKDMIQSVIIS